MSYRDLWDQVMAGKQCAPSDWPLFVREPWEDQEPAKAICARCPVQDKCLALADYFGEQAGVWGGLTEKERRGARQDARKRGVESPDSSALPGPISDDAVPRGTELKSTREAA